MRAYLFLLILISVTFNAGAQVLLRKPMMGVGEVSSLSAGATTALRLMSNPYLVSGVASIAASLLIWLWVLSRIEVGVAYPMASLGYVIAMILGGIFLNEAITPARIIGVVLICLGVVFISRPA